MIIKEFYRTREDDLNLYKIYSDKGFKILKLGTTEVYTAVIDVEDAGWSYQETSIKLPEEIFTAIINDTTDNSEPITTEEFVTILEEIF